MPSSLYTLKRTEATLQERNFLFWKETVYQPSLLPQFHLYPLDAIKGQNKVQIFLADEIGEERQKAFQKAELKKVE